MKDTEQEEWRDIPGFYGYQASTGGNIRSIYRTQGAAWKIFHPPPDAHGYLVTSLTINGHPIQKRVHSLVALTFLGPLPKGFIVHHRDENTLNNRACNLEHKQRGKHISEHLSDLSPDEKQEVRYLYMNHEHNLDKLAALMGVGVSPIRSALTDLLEVYN